MNIRRTIARIAPARLRCLSLVIGSLLLVAACDTNAFLSGGDYFFLERDGARMPVWVKGNVDSGIFLITVHGGPGDSGHEFALSRGFELLEERYAVVYWDQRFSGLSQGDPDRSEISAELFIEDTEDVVTLIRSLYDEPTLFLLGHSWGGQLSAGYLGRATNAAQFNGWINLDGAIYGDLESQLMKEWILEQVPAKLTEPGADVEFWEWAIEWYEANPNPDNYSDFEPYLFANALGGYAYDWEKSQRENPIPYGKLIFRSMFSFAYFSRSFDQNKLWADSLNFTPELSLITIPSLLLWGENDGAVPATVADYVYTNLATPAAEKRLIKIPECSHSPHFDQPERFAGEVRDFIEEYK